METAFLTCAVVNSKDRQTFEAFFFSFSLLSFSTILVCSPSVKCCQRILRRCYLMVLFCVSVFIKLLLFFPFIWPKWKITLLFSAKGGRDKSIFVQGFEVWIAAGRNNISALWSKMKDFPFLFHNSIQRFFNFQAHTVHWEPGVHVSP